MLSVEEIDCSASTAIGPRVTAQGPKLVGMVKGVIVYVITAGPDKKKWTFYTDLKNGEGKVGEGRVKKVRRQTVADSSVLPPSNQVAGCPPARVPHCLLAPAASAAAHAASVGADDSLISRSP